MSINHNKTSFRIVAESSLGVSIHEATVSACSPKEAKDVLLSMLSDEQREACVCIEFLDEVAS